MNATQETTNKLATALRLAADALEDSQRCVMIHFQDELAKGRHAEALKACQEALTVDVAKRAEIILVPE